MTTDQQYKWLRDAVEEIKQTIHGIGDKMESWDQRTHDRISSSEAATHGRINALESSHYETRERVAALAVKAGMWSTLLGSIGGLLTGLGAALMAIRRN